jgi:hypothetical protein
MSTEKCTPDEKRPSFSLSTVSVPFPRKVSGVSPGCIEQKRQAIHPVKVLK